MKRLIKSISIAVLLLVPTLMIAVNVVWGIPMKDIIIGIIVYAFYGMIVTVYLMRYALILIGVFAIYKIFGDLHTKRLVV